MHARTMQSTNSTRNARNIGRHLAVGAWKIAAQVELGRGYRFLMEYFDLTFLGAL